MMQDFLDTDITVQNLCKPSDGTTVELQVLARKEESTLVGMPTEPIQPGMVSSSDSDSDYLSDDQDSVISADDSDSSAVVRTKACSPKLYGDYLWVVLENRIASTDIMYGVGIRLATKDGARYVHGTCGGVLQLEIPNNSTRRVGLIAGPLLEQLSQTPNGERREYYYNRAIGDILHPISSREIPRHDWALFNVDNWRGSSKTLINRVTHQATLTIAKRSELPKQNIVVNILTSRGEVTGTLSSSTSGIMLDPDQAFVYVRMITMDRGSSLPNPFYFDD